MQSQTRKVYVKSGELEWVGLATGPLNAVKSALREGSNGKTLDSSYFFVDERGFHELDASVRVSISKGLAVAGFDKAS